MIKTNIFSNYRRVYPYIVEIIYFYIKLKSNFFIRQKLYYTTNFKIKKIIYLKNIFLGLIFIIALLMELLHQKNEKTTIYTIRITSITSNNYNFN